MKPKPPILRCTLMLGQQLDFSGPTCDRPATKWIRTHGFWGTCDEHAFDDVPWNPIETLGDAYAQYVEEIEADIERFLPR